MHVVTQRHHEKYKEYIRHKRHRKRDAGENYLRDKSSDDEQFPDASDRDELRIALTEFIRATHVKNFPRYYSIRIDTNRLNTFEIRTIVASYRDFDLYKLIRRETDPETQMVSVLCIHIGFNIL